jgi:putative oxidoreductase
MHNWLNKYSEGIYAAMRVVVGFLFACHGAQKYFGVLGGAVQIHTAKGLIAGTIELIGGMLIALGLFTSIAAFLASGEMAVAYFWVHVKRGFWPILNKGELPVALCFIFLYIVARGSGRYSLDHLLRRKRSVG